jgi:hypothetical protein
MEKLKTTSTWAVIRTDDSNSPSGLRLDSTWNSRREARARVKKLNSWGLCCVYRRLTEIEINAL